MRTTRLVLALIGFGLICGLSLPQAEAQPAGGAPTQEQPPKEVTLTQKQIDNLLAAHAGVAAIEAKIPESTQGAPPPRLMTQLDAAAKKHGFSGYDDYMAVAATAAMVMGGFDYETKKFIGPVAVIKKQIAGVQADKTMPPADRKQALAELNDSLQNAASIKPMPANIEIVGKNLDRLGDVFQQDE